MERTGVGANAILKNRRHEMPSGLNSQLIREWVRGNIKTYKQEYMDYLLELYKHLPDNSWIELDEDLLAKLEWKKKFLKGQLRSLYQKLPPEHEVGYPVLLNILNGHVRKARKLNVEYLLNL